MFILWFVVGVIVGALAAYANVALRFAQVHHWMATNGAILSRVHGRWLLTTSTYRVPFEGAATEKLLPFLFRVTITENR